MEQHPIPQNVSSYQFKLVGDMTLKQFFQVAGGVLIALIFYSTPLLKIIKIPLTVLSVLLGVGLAFLPFEERPLERWIVAFFRAIYSPTVFSWKKGSVSTKLFQDELPETPNNQQDIALKDYLTKTNHTNTSASGNLDKTEGNFFKNLASIFEPSVKPVAQAVSTTPTINTPITPVAPTISIQPTQPPIQQTQTNTVTPVEKIPAREILPEPEPAPVAQQTPLKNELKVPENTPISMPKPTQPINAQPYYPQNTTPITPNVVTPVMSGTNIIPASQAMFSPDAAPPNPPTYPNVVVGQIIDQDRRVIEGAIMEVRDSVGRPIRALRSNKVGHFLTVTQLDNGHYEIVIEKDGYEFTPISFEATGAIISPILIKGKRLSPLIEMPAVPVKPVYSIN